MSAKAEIKLTASFADDSKRDLTLGNFDIESVSASDIRGKVHAFNTNINDIKGIYLSDGGATCTGITAASIITTEETKFTLID